MCGIGVLFVIGGADTWPLRIGVSFGVLIGLAATGLFFMSGVFTYKEAPTKAQFLNGAQPPQQQTMQPAQATPSEQPYNNTPPTAATPRQVNVRGPDGRAHPGQLIAVAPGLVQVMFPDGTAAWFPESIVS
jgi:hypothetical protein